MYINMENSDITVIKNESKNKNLGKFGEDGMEVTVNMFKII